MFMDMEPLAAGVVGEAKTSNSSLALPEVAVCPVEAAVALVAEFNWLKSAKP